MALKLHKIERGWNRRTKPQEVERLLSVHWCCVSLPKRDANRKSNRKGILSNGVYVGSCTSGSGSSRSTLLIAVILDRLQPSDKVTPPAIPSSTIAASGAAAAAALSRGSRTEGRDRIGEERGRAVGIRGRYVLLHGGNGQMKGRLEPLHFPLEPAA